MARPFRRVARLAAVAALAAAASLAGVAWLDRVPARDLIPADAPLVVEALDAAGIVDRIEGTRFAAAWAGSATLAWLERTEPVAAFDRLRADVRRVTGIPLGRRAILDVVGAETAFAWYPGARPGEPPRWVAACRLSLRAWVATGVLRAAERAGFGGGIARERIGGRDAYLFPDGSGGGVRLLLVRRLLVAASDADLAGAAARCADGAASPVTALPSWASVRRRLPPRGALFAWSRAAGRTGLAPGAPGAPSRSRPGAAGLLVTAANPAEIHLFAEDPPAPPGAAPLPALPLLESAPLFFHASRGAPPPVIADLLRSRERAAAVPGPRAAALAPGDGYALVVTGAGGGSSLIPLPRGLLVVGMPDPGRAREALVRLFPAGSRSAPVAGTTAHATRESIPLAGEVELWGAAVGSSLFLATGTDLIAAAIGAPPAPEAGAAPAWRVDSISSIAMDKALPLLRRAAPPLAGMLAARSPDLADLARDVDLLGAVRSARLTAGADGEGARALATIRLRDLP